MLNSALLRRQIEETLADRIAAPLTTRERAEPHRIASGVTELDELLQGGLPIGVITELAGPSGSGRTTMALACMAAVARAGNVCAWIDVADALDPESVAANGVDLARLLWVRCGGAFAPAQAVVTDATAATAAIAPAEPGLPVRGGGSPHPRAEGRDMPEAIRNMLGQHGGLYDRQVHKMRCERRIIGTPGARNRPLETKSIEREEQVSTDRVPTRRQQQNFAARCAEAMPKLPTEQTTDKRIANVLARPAFTTQHAIPAKPQPRPWDALDQALKAADLLLQGGGFSMIVLDLGSTAPEHALRIPMATWFRFRAACERTRVSLVLLTQQPCARSSAELVVRLQTGTMQAESKVMTGIRFQSAAERGRRPMPKIVSISELRKPPLSERGEWHGRAAWAQAQ